MKAEFETVITFRPGWLKKRLGIRFDMLAFFRMLEEFGIGLGDDISQIGKIPFDELLSVAIFTGAESYAFHHRKTVWFDKATVLRWIDDSKLTRGNLKELGVLWSDFMADYTKSEKKKVKE